MRLLSAARLNVMVGTDVNAESVHRREYGVARMS
jgi:hypothetical protein